MSLPDENVPYETIVITQNHHINAAALSCTRKRGYMHLRSFKGSNTFENLQRMDRFSVNYISPDDKELFIGAAVKGWGNEESELEDEIEMHPFPHIERAKGWAICIPEELKIEIISDDIGETEVLHVKARILTWNGSAEDTIKVGEDRNIMALVAHTRYMISEGEVKEKFRKRIVELAERDDVVGRWVLEHL